MIHVDRSTTQPPQELLDDGPGATNAIAKIVQDDGPDALKSTDFDGGVYASEAVKEALWRMQHHKCCFCEKDYERKFSTVEHFRPKTRVRRSRSSTKKDLGYWWLGYEFENLYFCCSNCNTPKSDYFPLASGAGLAARDLPSKVAEDALVLDPGGKVDPADHITFVTNPAGEYRIAPKNGSARGRETIDAAKLDRDDLDELRAAHRRLLLERVAALFDEAKATALAPAVAAMARELCEASSPFALLARVFFQDRGIL